MAPFLLQRIMAMMCLIAWLTVSGVTAFRRTPRISDKEHIDEACPPCEILFSKLERTGREGKLSQHVYVHERGEPKSGSGVVYFWAMASLIHACDYLTQEFGEGSCLLDSLHSLFFEPGLGASDSKCSCTSIDRVSVVTSMSLKHTLPVKDTCAFAHGGGIEIRNDGKARRQPCTFADGTHVKSYDELWRCMHEANCDITDSWIQMAVFRDPRPLVVSTFYHLEVHAGRDLGDLEGFILRELPIVCQWMAVRYILFTGILVDQSMEIWYEDAMADPLGWHYQWFHSIGLQLPFHVVEAAAKAATANDLGFGHKKIDVHPGEGAKTEPGVRRFEDEVRPEFLAIADDVLRTWLPPVLLERFGVVPQ